jgi:hypothetical protein
VDFTEASDIVAMLSKTMQPPGKAQPFRQQEERPAPRRAADRQQ